MADPMWSGGAQQFQDWAPWIWTIMGDWARSPFYPDDPPKDPGAFTAQAMLVTNMPVLGTIYSPFIVEYCLYYTDQWDANPPATSSSTPEPPTLPETPAPNYGQDQDWLGRINAMWADVIYAGNEAHAAHLAADLILDRLPGGATPPIVASHTDQARILAAIYYTNWLWYTNPPPVSVPDVLQAVEDAHAATDADIATLQTSVNGLTTNVQEGFEDVETALGSISVDVAVPPVYPGLSGVTLGDSSNISGATRIAGAMDGFIYTITATPAGQSTQPAGARTRLKGVAWCAFEDDNGKLEPRQSMELDAGIMVVQSLAHAAAVVIYCKPGTQITVTPWTVA